MKIRKSTFETNSSSMHTVVIDSGGDYVPVSLSEITIEPGEFGWGYEELHSWQDRASYAYTRAADSVHSEWMRMLAEVIRDYTKVEPTFNVWDSEWDGHGYIDHQSLDEAATVFESEQVLKDFIFGVRSYVIIDNDNH